MAVNPNGGPGDIKPVEPQTRDDTFRNAICEIGVENACEWFGHYPNDDFTKATITELARWSEERNKQ